MNDAPPGKDDAVAERRSRWIYRLLAFGLLGVGLVLLAANLGALPPALSQLVRWVWPILLVAGGAWLAWGGRWMPDVPLADFTVERGSFEAAQLRVHTGAADLHLSATAEPGCLASGCYPGEQSPELHAEGQHASLVLDHRRARPFASGPWSVRLATDLPWDLNLQSNFGRLELDLQNLQTRAVSVRSPFGRLELTLPARIGADLDIRQWVGDVSIRVPAEGAVKVRLRGGGLVRARIDERRFVQMAPGEWISPLYAAAPQRCTLDVRLFAGDLTLS